MPGMKILSAMLIMVPATILMTAQGSLGEPAADPCKASPGGAAPKGMHWYYRITRATNKHCWYLGPVGIHIKSHASVATATPEPATARRLNAADADNAVPAQATTAEESEQAAPPLDAARAQASPQPSPMQTASAAPAQVLPAAPAQVLPAAPAQVLPATPAASAAAAAADPRFGSRWPENLPNAEDLEQSEPAAVGSSDAEPGDTGANAQMPANRPSGKTSRAAQASSGETVLRYFSIAGIVLIPLVLAAGWMAKFARESHGSDLPQRLRAMLERLRPRRRRKAFAAANFDAGAFDEAAFDEAVFDEADEEAFVAAPPISPAPLGRRAGADRRGRMVTDPAQDLKKSLTELMHDLRRAAAPEEPARYAQRSSYDRGDARVLSPSLQPAE